MNTDTLYLLGADVLLIIHTGFAVFVVLGLFVVLLGGLLSWSWVRNPWFRLAHLAGITIVVLQSWAGVICPLTTWEMALREQAGGAVYAGSFIAHWLESLLYYRAPEWVFVVVYTLFGALVVVSWLWVPPRRFGAAEEPHQQSVSSGGMTWQTRVRVLLVWLLILALAVANGSLREFVLTPLLGVTPGFLVSGVLLCGLILLVAYVCLPWLRVNGTSQLLSVGVTWLLLTLAFEFALGLAQGKSYAELLEAYHFQQGNIWPVVLLVTLVAPYLAAKLRGTAHEQ